LKLCLVERLSVADNVAKSFNILATSLSVPHNYFDGPNKIILRFLFNSDVIKLDVAKFIDTSIKSFFPCNITIYHVCYYVTITLLLPAISQAAAERYRNFRERGVKFILKDSSCRWGRVIKALNIRTRKGVPQSERALARGDNSRELIKRCINNRGWRASYRKRKRKGRRTRRRRARLSPPRPAEGEKSRIVAAR